jgi:hypothetical protein
MEIWKDIKGYEGKYQISSLGRVKSFYKCIRTEKGHLKRIKTTEGIVVKGRPHGNGYLTVYLYNERGKKTHYIHRLVAEAFLENSSNKEQVNHKDFNKQNNQVDNLEWVTRSQNRLHWKKSLKYEEDYENKMINITHKVVKRIKENKKDILDKRFEGKGIEQIASELCLSRDFVREVLYLFEN